MANLLLPGQPLSTGTPQLGTGTYARGEYVLASLVGYEQRTGGGVQVAGVDNRFVVPTPDAVVLGRVTRVTPRQAHLSILIVDDQPCGSSSSTNSIHVVSGPGNHAAGEGEGADFQGVIRAQDVRATDKDKVKLSDCFRPGDIVRATVISLGDARSYYLSTAANHLGVIYATAASSTPLSPSTPAWSPTRTPMLPISWQEMLDPTTGLTERRKCAKPLD